MARVYFPLLISAVLFASVFGVASSDVQISEVGLKGYYSTALPTPVVVQVKAPAGVDSIALDFAASLDVRNNLGPTRVDHFSEQVRLKPGEENQVVAPLLLTPSGLGRSTLEVDVSASAGHRIGSSSVDLNSLTRLTSETLIAIFCNERSFCDEAQSQISFSGSEEDVSGKNQAFKFVTFLTARHSYLDYASAKFVVVAGRVSDWNPDQQFALEAYARTGGTIVLLEKECGDNDYLGAYRSGPIKDSTILGRGKLYRVASLQSKDLGAWFAGKNLKKNNIPAEVMQASDVDPLRRWVAVSFDFPRLRWFLIWMAVYIVIVGVGNFALLRRFRRLEWGWVTTTGIAVLFAIGLYFISSLNRPKQVTLDDIAVYWMDTRSPNAWGNVGLRVSSPERQELELSVGDHATLTSRRPTNLEPNVDIAMEITREDQPQPGWDVHLGDPTRVSLSLYRWSFADFDFQTFHTFSGSVTMGPKLVIKNATGQQFQQAMYLDFPENI
jgi:hypothetical protein